MEHMATTSNVRERARQRLDERLTVLKPESRFAPPPKGWMRAIRDAIGMSGAQFAARLGIKPPSVIDLEKSERQVDPKPTRLCSVRPLHSTASLSMPSSREHRCKTASMLARAALQ